MPTLAQLGSLQIRIYADDHYPPHFHVWATYGEALIRLDGLLVLSGRIRRKDMDMVRAWAQANMELLENEWKRLNER